MAAQTHSDVISYLRELCSHSKHGRCETRACFVRGGWDGKTVPIPVEPTCEYEIAAACVAAFSGREIATEKITEGLFWEMRDALHALLQETVDALCVMDTNANDALENQPVIKQARALLAKLEE